VCRTRAKIECTGLTIHPLILLGVLFIHNPLNSRRRAVSLRFPFSLPKSGLLGISHGVSFEVDARHAEKYAGRGASIAAMPEGAAAPRTDPLMGRRPGAVDRAATEVICSAGVKSATRPRNNFPERANGSRTRMHRLIRNPTTDLGMSLRAFAEGVAISVGQVALLGKRSPRQSLRSFLAMTAIPTL